MSSRGPTAAPARPHRRLLRLLLRTAAVAAAAAVLAAAALVVTLPDTAALRTENPTSTAFTRRWVEQRRAEGHEVAPPTLAWVPLSRISRPLQRAVLMSEDQSFFVHQGFDWDEMKAAWRRDLAEGRLARGGSTLTMQLAKNLYLTPSKNPLRKLREALITVELERDLSKPRLLEIYLNVIEWGDGVYGIENAARHYYGKPAAALDEDEAAWLAACIPNPRHFNPGHVTPGLRARHDHLVEQLRRYRIQGFD